MNSCPFSLMHPSGMHVRGVWFPCRDEGKRTAVILSHGFNGCCADLYDQAMTFAEAGIHTFVFDFRGGGERTTSDGRLSEMMTVDTECADLRLVMNYVQGLDCVDSTQLFLLGGSQGGLISTLVTEKYPDEVAGMILWFPALMIPEASKIRMERGITEVFGIRLSPEFDREAAQIDPWTDMKKYTRKVLMIHGDKDPVVPLSVSEKAAGLFPDAEVVVIPGAGHGFRDAELDEALKRSVSMIADVLEKNKN